MNPTTTITPIDAPFVNPVTVSRASMMLKYYRQNVRDARLASPDLNSYAFERIPRKIMETKGVNPELVARLIKNNPQKGKKSVILCPRILRSDSGSSKDVFTAICILCNVASDGSLIPDETRAPWIPRNLLEPLPTSRTTPVLGTTKQYDIIVARHVYNPVNIHDALSYADMVLREITGFSQNMDIFRVDGYTLTDDALLLPDIPYNVTTHMLDICEHLDAISGTQDFQSLIADTPLGAYLIEKPSVPFKMTEQSRRLVCGLMTGHCLSLTQNLAAAASLSLIPGEMQVIVGPAGVGKTTTIQAIAASMVVAAASSSTQAIIIGAAPQNDSALNMIRSLRNPEHLPDEPSLTNRWLPDLVGYGLFLASSADNIAANVGLPYVTPSGYGSVDHMMTAEYLARAERHFAESFKLFAQSKLAETLGVTSADVSAQGGRVMRINIFLRKKLASLVQLIGAGSDLQHAITTAQATIDDTKTGGISLDLDAGLTKTKELQDRQDEFGNTLRQLTEALNRRQQELASVRQRINDANREIDQLRKDVTAAIKASKLHIEQWYREYIEKHREIHPSNLKTELILFMKGIPFLSYRADQILKNRSQAIGEWLLDRPLILPPTIDPIDATAVHRFALATLQRVTRNPTEELLQAHDPGFSLREIHRRQDHLRNAISDLEESTVALKEDIASLETEIASVSAEASKIRAESDDISRAMNQFLSLKNQLEKWARENGLRPSDEEAIDKQLDRLRTYAFFLALHTNEGAWIEETKSYINSEAWKANNRDARTTLAQKSKWQRLAKIFPVFVGTAYLLPKFFRAAAGSSSDQTSFTPLYKLADMLVIEEAAQTPPELAIPLLPFARRAIFMGDPKQNRPISNIPVHPDMANARSFRVIARDGDFPNFAQSGKDSSGGCALMAARSGGSYSDGINPGSITLREHFRCKDAVIAYANKAAYGGALIPSRIDNDAPAPLPPWLYVNATPIASLGQNSQSNLAEIDAIVAFMKSNKNRIEQVYQAPVESCVAILSPFRAQITKIRESLRTHGFDVDNMLISTAFGVQGQERNIVLFSAVYSDLSADGNLLNGTVNLINTAATRGRDSFVYFGNIHMLRDGHRHLRILYDMLIQCPAEKLLSDSPAEQNRVHEDRQVAFSDQDQEISANRPDLVIQNDNQPLSPSDNLVSLYGHDTTSHGNAGNTQGGDEPVVLARPARPGVAPEAIRALDIAIDEENLTNLEHNTQPEIHIQDVLVEGVEEE